MEKSLVRGALVLLIVSMLVSILPFAVLAEYDPETDSPPADFVLLVDCSQSLAMNDPKNLTLAACKSFIDSLPDVDTRVTIVAFGVRLNNHTDISGNKYKEYSFSDADEDWGKYLGKKGDTYAEANYVYLLNSMTQVGTSKERAALKKSLERALTIGRDPNNQGESKTPIGAALAAAILELKKSGSVDEQACIVLISDGVEDHNKDFGSKDPELYPLASKAAGEHSWPIFCVNLNYSEKEKDEYQSAKALMKELCANSGQKVDNLNSHAYQECSEAIEVYEKMGNIFSDFYHGNWNTDLVSAPCDFEFEIPNLTSEASVSVFGAKIDSITLYTPGKDIGTTIDPSTQYDVSDRLKVSAEDTYYTLRLICPKEGSWRMHIEATEPVQVRVGWSTVQEYGIKMGIKSMGEHTLDSQSKKDRLVINSYLSYHEIAVDENEFYKSSTANVLVLDSKTGAIVCKKAMDGSLSGYYLELPMAEFAEGNYVIYTELEHPMFRNLVKESNAMHFSVKNQKCTTNTAAAAIQLKTTVGHEFDRINAAELFNNPDGDDIAYAINCISDRSIKLDFSEDSDYITIFAGTISGTFNVEILASDPDMSEPAKFEGVTLTVVNNEPEYNAAPTVDLWTKKYPMQKHSVGAESLNLGSYFYDPDGLPMSYRILQIDNECISATLSDGELTISPITAGKATISISASDGELETTGRIKVTVSNGRSVFWMHYGPVMAIIAGILVFIASVIIALLQNRHVKGIWDIRIDKGYENCSLRINLEKNTKAGRKRKFTLLEGLLEAVNQGLVSPDVWTNHLTTYFGNTDANGITLVGVIGKRGCKIVNIPADGGESKVFVNGIPAKKTAQLKYGSIVVEIPMNGETLRITMELV